ncbi:dihydroxyacetone kinase subunit DhaL [Sporolactobacillus terrae]|uniref:dihydroxyacetone kinase subunit DhaL n=1 Tax=Sporolactobacillus terrae TaxID=269673 RepID=UPI001119DD6D|nr:dihydroxyacetone kinase subunit DhaL [Sporolactobacillus terrae]
MLMVDKIKKWLELFAAQLHEKKTYLSELDSAIGDGDHGNNMARGADFLLKSLDQSGDTSAVFKNAAMALLSKVGGASGPLYGSALLALSKKAGETDDRSEWIAAGAEAIAHRGKSEAGDKTMLDVWLPVQKALADGTLTHEKIDAFVAETKSLKAKKGRASYLGDRSIGHIDPGAQSSGYLFHTFLEAGADHA